MIKNIEPSDSKKLSAKPYSQAWQRHLSSLELHAGVMSRGRSLLRKVGIADLEILGLKVNATLKIEGSNEFHSSCTFKPLDELLTERISDYFHKQPKVFAEFFSGHFSPELHSYLCRAESEGGLFPEISSLKLSCDCIEDISPCSHTAALLYGLGILFDENPKLLLDLRAVEVIQSQRASTASATQQTFDTANLSKIFEIELT